MHSYINNGETISKTDASRAGRAGLAFKTGGLLFIFYFIGLDPLLKASDSLLEPGAVSTLKTAVSCVTSLLLACGLLGFLSLGVAGTGGQRGLSVTGTLLALLGLTSYIVGSIFIHNFPESPQFFTPGGSVLIMLGMLMLGAVVRAARALRGWRKWAPLLVGLYFPLQFPLQAVFFLKHGRGPSPILLGMWGVFWILLGAAVCTSRLSVVRNSATARLGAETYKEERVASHQAG